MFNIKSHVKIHLERALLFEISDQSYIRNINAAGKPGIRLINNK